MDFLAVKIAQSDRVTLTESFACPGMCQIETPGFRYIIPAILGRRLIDF